MVADTRGHNVPAAGDTPRRQTLLDLALSINDFVSVANATDRAQKLADIGASAARPLLVYRQDLGRFEWTSGGGSPAWRDLSGRLGGASPHIRMRKSSVQPRSANSWGQVFLEAVIEQAGDQPWTVPGDGSITVTQAGLYMFDSSVTMTAPGTFAVRIYRVADQTVLDASPASSGASFTNHAHAVRRLAAGDTIVTMVYPTAAGMSVQVDVPAAPSFMTVTRLSD